MSETTAAETAPATESPVEPPAPAPQVEEPAPVDKPADVEPTTETGPDLAAELEKWKSLSKKNEQRAKANADKAQRFDEIEEANKSEKQKLEDGLAAARQEAAELRTFAMRAEKSASTGVPMSVIPNGTEEAMDEAIAAHKGAVASEVAKAVADAIKNRPPGAAPANLVTSGRHRIHDPAENPRGPT